MIVITVEAIRRAHLQERYAILWIATGMLILATAFFPQILNVFRLVLGSDYVAVVIGILFTFLLLIAFHFSISLSTLRKNQTQIVQKLALIEQNLSDLSERMKKYHPSEEASCTTEFPLQVPFETMDRTEDHARKTTRSLRGAHVAVAFIIPLAVLSVLFIGLKTPEPMVGDEVTHYYMLVKQSKSLSKPNFYAQIPVEYGDSIERRYPHPFLWHYLGAVFYKFGGKQFFIVQVYQALFWAQLLVFSYLLVKSRNGFEGRSILLYLIIIASLPVALIFSVTFYQDVPMTAQVVTAFYFLRQRRWLASTLFLCFAIGLKVTAILFLPAFFLLTIINEIKSREWFWGSLRFTSSAAVVFIFIMSMGQIVQTHAETDFYPAKKMQEIISRAKHVFKATDKPEPKNAVKQQPGKRKEGSHPKKPRPVTPYEAEIIANHPGDLRIPENYFVYGGIL
ncbi:MAG: DUF2304 family protein, partial [Deltaproteobacteria bacterium]|nr:DUF2304 family protein [Deltaproteobacteria bacterium]